VADKASKAIYGNGNHVAERISSFKGLGCAVEEDEAWANLQKGPLSNGPIGGLYVKITTIRFSLEVPKKKVKKKTV